MIPQLEDDFLDIIGKARNGLGLSVDAVSEACGLSPPTIRSLESGAVNPDDNQVHAIAEALRLDPGKLLRIARHNWGPEPMANTLSPSVIPLNGRIGGYEVHGYLCFDPRTRDAALIDTAYEPQLALSAIRDLELSLRAILLTHCHPDHIGGLDRLREETGARVITTTGELNLYRKHSRIEPDTLIGPGEMISTGFIEFIAHSTPGHTPGGVSYQTGAMVFPGDALFAGSTGRSMSPEGYTMLLTSLTDKILSLPYETRLFPGHGPATTVGEERNNNPFFIG